MRRVLLLSVIMAGAAYGLFLAYMHYVIPYLVGLWLIH